MSIERKPGRPSKRDAIRAWRLKYPLGKKAACIKELGVTRPTVDAFWHVAGLSDDSRSAYEIVQEWKENNPGGRKVDCVRETGLSRRSVYYVWEEKKKPCKKKPIFVIENVVEVPKEDNEGQFLLF